MIGMMMMTFILFFAFVVNTGMLVNAKINLQNAADLAAYSGAATQARQLNSISYLNYEMRRQYKKFLFRYYVLGNMAQAGFPRTGGQSKTPYKWSPDGTLNYGIPAVCIIFDSKVGSNDNYCQLKNLPKINIPAANAVLDSFDMINATLTQQLQAIEQIRQANCGSIANANISVLLLWLFNTDPEFKRLPNVAVNPNSPDLPNILNVSRAIANGLGLVPREIILHERINTLASYVNSPPQTGVSHSTLSALEGGQDPAANERTIQAFLSAYYTLGEHTFNSDQIEMDELLPSGTNNLLNLNLIQQDIDAYAVRYVTESGAEIVAGSGGASDCQPKLQPVTIHKIPLGVSKDPGTLTYYAVRLKATAKVMFSPFGDMELKAYAAARPFGSRIGPPSLAVQSQFAYQGGPADPSVILQGTGIASGSSLAGMIPNIAISADEPSSQSTGWNDSMVLGAMYEQIFGGAPAQGGALQQSQFAEGLQAAMSPNPIEGNLYNIMNDLGNDAMVKNFDTQDEATFWAPVVSPAKQGNLSDVLQQDLQDLFAGVSTAGAGSSSAGGTASALQQSLSKDIIQYAQTLQNGGGEPSVPGGPGESINLVRLQDPIAKNANKQPVTMTGVTLNDPAQLKTSYVNTLDSDIQAGGRVGYSVKFVSFDSLLNPIAADGLSGVPNNTRAVQNDAEAGQDVTVLKH